MWHPAARAADAGCDSRPLLKLAPAFLQTTPGGLYAGDDIEQLWHEYEDASTPEANLVKDFDKVELRARAARPAAAPLG